MTGLWDRITHKLGWAVERETPSETKILADIATCSLPGSIVRVPTGWTPPEYCRFLVGEGRRRGINRPGIDPLTLLDMAENALRQLRDVLAEDAKRRDAR